MATILVVEDISNIRKFVSLNLRASGYQVLEAANAEEALAMLAEPPSLIILDLALPEVDGWQLLSQMVAHPSMSDIPVILTTVTVLQEGGPQTKFGNVAGVLPKPFSAEQLVQVVDETIRSHP